LGTHADPTRRTGERSPCQTVEPSNFVLNTCRRCASEDNANEARKVVFELKQARKKSLQAELAVITRKHKQKNLSQKELLTFLERQLSPEDRGVLEKAKGQRGWTTTDADAMAYAVEHLTHWRNVVPEKKLCSGNLKAGQRPLMSVVAWRGFRLGPEANQWRCRKE
jgi:hypothetical protein